MLLTEILTSSNKVAKLGRLLSCTMLNQITSGIHENGLAFTDCRSKDAPPIKILKKCDLMETIKY